ncbi:fibritin [Pantoea phage Phynn]|nr:fibritin [Pantoea phage Phynn]
MILKIGPLPKIPYVDGAPLDAAEQTRISWIINGETLFGAKDRLGNDGQLNRSGVAIQRNAVQLELNTEATVTKVNEVIDQVNLITDNLEAIADQSVTKTLNKAVADIRVLQAEVSQDGIDILSVTDRTTALENAIGEYDPEKDPKHRTLRDDIIFLKKELGAYSGFDQNGDSDTTSTGSGMKYKIMQNARGVSMHEARITKLEDDWVSSDVGQVTDELNRIRTEIGPRGLATLDSIYVRLNKQTNSLTATNEEIKLINSYIGRSGSGEAGSITLRMASAEDSIRGLQNTIDTPTTGLVDKVIRIDNSIGSNKTTPGTLRYDIEEVSRSVFDINMLLGEDGTEGIRGDVAQALSDIGTDSDPTAIKGRLLTLENTTKDIRTNLSDVSSVVGDSNTGLVAANLIIGKEIYGNAEGSDQFEKDGIKASLQKLIASVGGSGEDSIQKQLLDLVARIEALETNDKAQDNSILLLNQLQVK